MLQGVGLAMEKCLEVTVTQFSLVTKLVADEVIYINRILCLYFHFTLHPRWVFNTLQHVEVNLLLNIYCGECFQDRVIFVRLLSVGENIFSVSIGFPFISAKLHLTPLLLSILWGFTNQICSLNDFRQLVFLQKILLWSALIQGWFRVINFFCK